MSADRSPEAETHRRGILDALMPEKLGMKRTREVIAHIDALVRLAAPDPDSVTLRREDLEKVRRAFSVYEHPNDYLKARAILDAALGLENVRPHNLRSTAPEEERETPWGDSGIG